MPSKRSMIRIAFSLLPLLILLVLFLALRNGVRVSSVGMGGYQIEKLYLKLDKRLVLRIGRLTLPRGEAPTPEMMDLPRMLGRLHRLLSWFDEIELQELDFPEEHYRLIYRDHILYLKNREYEIAGMLYDRGSWMEVQVPLMRIPRYHLDLSGELGYDYRSGRIVASGFYHVEELTGHFRIRREGEKVRFSLDALETSSPRRLLGLVKMSPEAREWLEERVGAQRFRLVKLEGEGRYDPASGRFEPELGSLKGEMELRRVRVRFRKGLDPLEAQRARVLLQEGNLYFLFEAPHYAGHDLEGSSAALLHLADPQRLTLLLRLRYRGRIDWPLLRIPASYGYELPVGQRSGRAVLYLDLDIPLERRGVKMQGSVALSRGELELGGHPLPIGGGELSFNSRRLRIHRLLVEEPCCTLALRGDLPLADGRTELSLELGRLSLGEGVLRMGKVRIPLRIERRAEEWRVDAPTLRTRLCWSAEKGMDLALEDLSRWKPYLGSPFDLLDGGSLRVRGRPEGELTFRGRLLWRGSPLYTREGPVTDFPFTATLRGGKLRFESLEGKLRLMQPEGRLEIRNLNVDAKRLMAILKRLEARGAGAKKGTGAKGRHWSVTGQKSLIRYGSHVLLNDRYRLDLNGEELHFFGMLGKERVTIERKGGRWRVDAPEIDDRMLHALIHFDGLRDGRYSFHLEGNEAEGYRGEIGIEGGVVKDFRAFNDLMAFLNTLPALVSLSDPGFSARGFEIRKGKIRFTLKGERLTIDSLLLRGSSSTIVGQGSVELDSGRIGMELAIQTARELGSVIGKIPVVGYILFGKDESLTVGLRIDGTLDRPKIHTNPVGEALLYPLDLLRRTLGTPARLAAPKQRSVPTIRQSPSDGNVSVMEGNASSGMF